jgi:hypothetical protein
MDTAGADRGGALPPVRLAPAGWQEQGDGGSWMAYKTSSTNLRVCKIAGTYGGGGAYWIQVTGKQP